MQTQEKRMENLTKFATVLTKLIEVAYWIGAVAMVVAVVLVAIDPYVPGQLVRGVEPGEELGTHGFSIVIAGPDGVLIRPAMVIFLLTAAVVLSLMARVFRDVHLVLRTTQGLTKFSQGKTPFQKDNVRMLREMGFFLLAVRVVELVAEVAAVLALGPEQVESSVGLNSFAVGILMLCLSQAFAQGVQMQRDVDGMV